MLTRKPWQPDRVIWLLAAFLCSGLLGQLVVQGYAAALSKGETPEAASAIVMILGTFTYQGVTLILVGVFLRIHQISWADAFGFNSPRRGRAVLLAVLTCMLILPVAWKLGELSKILLEHFGFRADPQHAVQTVRTAHEVSQQVCLAFVAIVMAPIVEELIFRGILYPTIKQLGLRKTALWGTSLFFAASHFDAPTFVPLAVLAVILTLLYETTNNLLAPMVAHSLFNAVNYVWLLYEMRGAPPTV